MTIPVPSTRNSHTKIKATQENRFVHRHIQKTRRPRHTHPIHPTSPSNHKVANATSQQMPTQTQPSTPCPQLILVLCPSSSGHTTHRPCHRSARPPSSRKIPPTHPDPRHPILPSKPQSPRPQPTLPSILQDHPPPAPPNRLRAKESKNPCPRHPSRLQVLPRSHRPHLLPPPPLRIRPRDSTIKRPPSPRHHSPHKLH